MTRDLEGTEVCRRYTSLCGRREFSVGELGYSTKGASVPLPGRHCFSGPYVDCGIFTIGNKNLSGVVRWASMSLYNH